MAEPDEKLYEKVDELDSIGKIRRFKANVISTGTRVKLHEIDDFDQKLDREDIMERLKRFARLRDPRVPSLIDATLHHDRIDFVILEQEGQALESLEGRNIIENQKKDYGFEISYQTLAALSTLHQVNVTHRHLRKECFLIHESGMVFLQKTGILSQLNQLIEDQLSGDDDGGLLLASNLSGHDVADWACMIATILLGKPVLDPSLRIEGEEIQPELVAVAQKDITKSMGDTAFSRFIVKCMEARADNVGGFDNATDAIRNFPIEGVRS